MRIPRPVLTSAITVQGQGHTIAETTTGRSESTTRPGLIIDPGHGHSIEGKTTGMMTGMLQRLALIMVAAQGHNITGMTVWKILVAQDIIHPLSPRRRPHRPPP